MSGILPHTWKCAVAKRLGLPRWHEGGWECSEFDIEDLCCDFGEPGDRCEP